jgi:hypothetical protein
VVSADDLLTPGSLSRAVSLMECHESIGFVYGRAQHFRGLPRQATSKPERWVLWNGADWLERRCKDGYNVIASPEVVMRADLLRRLGGYNSNLPHSGDLELWLRAAAVADVGYVAGPSQALYRQHGANMHHTVFGVTDFHGQLVDLEHRWRAFSSVVHGVGIANASRLDSHVRARLAEEALWRACHAFERGLAEFPVAAFEDFASSLDPRSSDSQWARRLRRRKALGMTALPIHPLWAPSLVSGKLGRLERQWRLRTAGV